MFEFHCDRGRRFTGHDQDPTAPAQVDLHVSGEALTWFSPHPTVEYGFCSSCGSSML